MSSQLSLDSDFQSFRSNDRFQFEVSQPTFEVEVSCKIAFLPSNRDAVLIEIDADAETLKDFTVSQRGKTITIKQKGSSSSGNVIIGDVVMSGGKYNMSGVQINGGNSSVHVNGNHIETRNGKTYVNGVPVDGVGNANSKVQKEPRIQVFAPEGSSLEANLSGESILVSKVAFDEADVSANGSASVGLEAHSASLDFSGIGKGYILLRGGDLDVDVSGQGNIEVQGEWEDAKVDLSGMGQVNSTGTCKGNYKANVSGMGSITHRGSVSGRVKKNVSGMGRINIG